MIALDVTGNNADSALSPRLQLLETLQTLLEASKRYLAGGEAEPLLQASSKITAMAEDLTAMSLQLARCPVTPEVQQERTRRLALLRQQSDLCRALLRRWRRSIFLRQQFLAMREEPVPCCYSMPTPEEIR